LGAKSRQSPLTLFAFSSENWSRPEEEVSSLMSLFIEALRREVDELHHNNVQLKFIGSRGQLSRRLQEKIAKAEEKTAGNTGLHLTVAIAYGGRWDIIEASKAVAREVAAGSLNADDIDDAVPVESSASVIFCCGILRMQSFGLQMSCGRTFHKMFLMRLYHFTLANNVALDTQANRCR
jgi:undecaprenyl diphosphate synthase